MGKYGIRVGAKEMGHAWSDPSRELSENRLAAYTNHADGKTFSRRLRILVLLYRLIG